MTTSISTQYLMTALSASTMKAQAQLATAQTETSTGQYANLGLQLGSEAGYELSLKNHATLLQSFTDSNSILSTNLSVSQTALDSIRTGAQEALQNLTAWSSSDNPGSTLQSLGTNSLQSLITSANTTSNGQYVFGGINSSVAPVADYFSSPVSAAKSAIDQAFTTTFGVSPSDPAAASISATDIQNFLSSQINSQFQGTAWTSAWSSASNTNITSEISPGQSIQSSVSANSPGFQKLTEAYAILSEFGGGSLNQSAQQAVASTATSLLSQGLNAITATEANVGAAQQRITDANASISSQLTILQTQIGSMDNVNQYAAATAVNSLNTQIQTSYELTARLQQLNLAQYLPVP